MKFSSKPALQNLIDERYKNISMLVDQEENPDQSRSFEGDKDVLIGKEWQEVSQCNIYFKPALGLLISCNTKHILNSY